MMKCTIRALLASVLFIILVPGLFLRIPQRGPLLTAALVHAVVFFLIYTGLTMMMKVSEGFGPAADKPAPAAAAKPAPKAPAKKAPAAPEKGAKKTPTNKTTK